MGSFSIWHWLIVLVIVMLIFGTKKLRNMGTDLGGAVKGFKDGMRKAATRRPRPRRGAAGHRQDRRRRGARQDRAQGLSRRTRSDAKAPAGRLFSL